MSTEVGSTLQSVVQPRSSKCMKEVNELLQLIYSVCLDGIVICNSSAGIEEERN